MSEMKIMPEKVLSKVEFVSYSNDHFPSIFQMKLTVYQHFNKNDGKMAIRQNSMILKQACRK